VPDLTSSPAAVVADTIVRTVELGVTITDAAVDGDATVVFCELLDDGRRHCPGCGGEGTYRDTVIRKVTDVPVIGHPLRLRVRVPRYRCTATNCDREVFAHNTDRLARRGWTTTRRYARYILRRLMIDRATVAAVARELGLSWDTVNTIAMDATQMIVAAGNDTDHGQTGTLDRPSKTCPEQAILECPRQDSNLYETVGVAAVSYMQFWYFDLVVSLVYQPEDSAVPLDGLAATLFTIKTSTASNTTYESM
jgi:hypothetical protein